MSAVVLWRPSPADYRRPADDPTLVSGVAEAPVQPAAPDVVAGPARPRRRLSGFARAEREAVGLRYDCRAPAAPPSAGMPLNLLEIDGRELGDLLAESGERAHARAALACHRRRRFARQRIGRCFVAMASGARPCFVQWLFDHTDNQALRHSFGDAFPHLMRDEALLDGGFVPATFAAERVVPAAMARLAAKAEALGVRWVHCFVPVDDPARLRATIAAGFAIHQWRVQRRVAWWQRTRFGPLPDGFELRLG